MDYYERPVYIVCSPNIFAANTEADMRVLRELLQKKKYTGNMYLIALISTGEINSR